MVTWGAKTTAEDVAAALSRQIAGKNVLITGASPNGLGAEVVRVLAKHANLVILAGRNKTRLEQTVADAKIDAPNANLRVLILDLLSRESVTRAASEVLSYQEPLHVLFNNAAMSPEKYTTVEGIEAELYGNHVSPFLFTNLILPKLRQASSSHYSPRIVNVSSFVHAFGPIRFSDLNFRDGADWDLIAGYAQTKTANILFANSLAKRLQKEGILAYSIHPGGAYSIKTNLILFSTPALIKSGVFMEDGSMNSQFGEFKTLGEGAATHIVAGFDPSIENQSGSYLLDCQIHNEQLAPHATDNENADRLWALTEEIVGQRFL